MLGLRTITLSQTNCYVLKAKEGYLLIDCGNVSDKKAFLSNLGKLGIALADISYLFLTHHHNDHSGLLGFMISANPKIQVIMSSKCAQYLKNGIHYKHRDERYPNPALRLMLKIYTRLNRNWSENFVPYFTRASDIIIDQDDDYVLSELGVEGRILFTPGHTDDSISLVTDKAAFVGDAARNMLNFTGRPYHPILLYDLAACYESWDKLLNTGASTIYPSHGKPFDSVRLKILCNHL